MPPKRRDPRLGMPRPPRAPSVAKRVQYMAEEVQGRTGTGQPRHRSKTPSRGNIKEDHDYDLKSPSEEEEDLGSPQRASPEPEEPSSSRNANGKREIGGTTIDKGLNSGNRPSRMQGPAGDGPSGRQPSETPQWVKDALPKFVADSESNDNGKDIEVCQKISEVIVANTVKLADKYFTQNVDMDGREYMHRLFREAPPQLIRYIGCLAMGGPNGEKDWEELLTQAETRHALAVGIIGRAVKEYVFGDIWFGGTAEHKKQMADLEESVRFKDSLDGFARTRERALLAQKFASVEDDDEINEAAQRLARKLTFMLKPFKDKNTDAGLDLALGRIIIRAGYLSRLMRQAPDVVYYWPPTFKDEEFEPSRMECLNLNYMITNSPYKKKKVGGIERATLIDDKPETVAKSEAIVRVVCFPGLVAYRRKGGKLAAEEIAQEKNRKDYAPADVQALRRAGVDALTSETGFRSKVIYKSIVFLKWGQQRLLTKEAGTSAHIDAMKKGDLSKYTSNYQGFKELWNIYEDWYASE